MFKAILLVCATSVQPADCNEKTATHVVLGPDATNEISCAMQSQAYLANTAIGRSLEDDGYLKIKCTREYDGPADRPQTAAAPSDPEKPIP